MSRPLPLSLRLVPLLASFGLAQTVPPAPGPHAHASEAVTLEHFVVTASPFQRAQADLAQATTVLAGTALEQRRALTLGETLTGLPGLSSTWHGPGASRPVIRGLGGDRVRLLENGTGTLDASVISPDHAVSVEPLVVESIEVVRGPASLLYGGSAIGGVVNVLTHRIETDLPERAVSGGIEGRHGTAADEFSAGGTVNVALRREPDHALVLHLDGFHRDTGDLAIPGFAESARLRAAEIEHAREAGEPLPGFARDVLPNSRVHSRGGAAGLSWVGKNSHFGFSRSLSATEYGVPGHAHAGGDPVRIDLRQRRWDVQGASHERSGLFSGGRFKFGHADYEHRELEGVEVGTTYRQRGSELRAELLHDDLAGLAGTWGAQFNRNLLAVEGDEAFLPPARTAQQAFFAFEEFRRGEWSGEFGARHERQEIDVRDGSGRGRTDGSLSLSAGAVWNPADGWTLALSVVRSQRAPNAQELYAYGPHLGTNAFEIGSPVLARERALGLEASVRRRSGRVTGEVTLFAQRFRGFVYERDTGRVAAEGADGFELADPASLPAEAAEGALAVLEFAQTSARFHGAETEMRFHLHDAPPHQLDLRLAADFVRAEDDAGRPLPRIPAARFAAGLDWRHGPWAGGVEWQRTARQRRVAAREAPSSGYSSLSAQLSWCHQRGDHAWELFLRGTNLTDAEARPHLSFLKELAPLPGRNVTAGVRWEF